MLHHCLKLLLHHQDNTINNSKALKSIDKVITLTFLRLLHKEITLSTTVA